MRCSEEDQGRASSPTAVVSGTLRPCHQCRGTAFPGPDLVLRFLARSDTCAGKCYELGTRYVYWYDLYINVLLLFQRTVCVRRANWADEGRYTRFVRPGMSGIYMRMGMYDIFRSPGI